MFNTMKDVKEYMKDMEKMDIKIGEESRFMFALCAVIDEIREDIENISNFTINNAKRINSTKDNLYKRITYVQEHLNETIQIMNANMHDHWG